MPCADALLRRGRLSGSIYYLFVQEGVYEMAADFPLASFKSTVWTLIDSHESSSGAPLEVVLNGTRLFVIYATSPTTERWRRLHKIVHERVVTMNPWTRDEIHRAWVMSYIVHTQADALQLVSAPL
jgi:di/tricarboxylate transporter